VLHHVAGVVAGLGLGLGVVVLGPRVGRWAAVLSAATVLTVVIINLFGLVVLPFAGLDEERREATLLQWLFSVTVYGVVVVSVTLYALGM
jgi:hypothetical protein